MRTKANLAVAALLVALLAAGTARHALPRAEGDAPAELRLLGTLAREARRTLAAAVFLRVDYYYHTTPGDEVYSAEILPLLRLAVALDPNFTRAIALLAFELEIRVGRRDEARALLERGIAENPADPFLSDLHGGLGMLHFRAGRTAEALLHLGLAARTAGEETDPEDLYIHVAAYDRIAAKAARPVPPEIAALLAALAAERAAAPPAPCPCGHANHPGHAHAHDLAHSHREEAGHGHDHPEHRTAAPGLARHEHLDEAHREGEVQPFEAPRLAAALRTRTAALCLAALILLVPPLLRGKRHAGMAATGLL